MYQDDFQVVRDSIISYGNTIFEPTVNIFQNGIVINHQKVGTRFLEKVVSETTGYSATDNRQIMFKIFRDPTLQNNTSTINYHMSERYVFTPWHDLNEDELRDRPLLKERYKDWKDDKTFFESNGVETYTDFFFNNPKDIYFIIRSPIHRFFSGILEILSVEPEGITLERFRHIIMNNWKSIFEDIHTIHYLEHVKEMIYNIKDKSKIKIIDLSHLKSKQACEFFCNLRGDDKVREIYNNIHNNVDSNKILYSQFYSLYSQEDLHNSSFVRYLKTEYYYYQELKNSQYFLDLS